MQSLSSEGTVLHVASRESYVITIIIEHLWESVGLVSLFAVTSISNSVSPKTSTHRKSMCQMLWDGSSMRAKLYEGQAVF